MTAMRPTTPSVTVTVINGEHSVQIDRENPNTGLPESVTFIYENLSPQQKATFLQGCKEKQVVDCMYSMQDEASSIKGEASSMKKEASSMKREASSISKRLDRILESSRKVDEFLSKKAEEEKESFGYKLAGACKSVLNFFTSYGKR